jgi:hypothetical protein
LGSVIGFLQAVNAKNINPKNGTAFFIISNKDKQKSKRSKVSDIVNGDLIRRHNFISPLK